MNAHAQLRAHLNVIHGELAARGIHSTRIENATYCIETLSRAFMETGVNREWERCRFTKTHITIGNLLLARIGRVVSEEAVYDALYSGRAAGDLPDATVIKIFMHHMRKRLKAHDSAYVIENVAGVGHRLILKPSALALSALHELKAH